MRGYFRDLTSTNNKSLGLELTTLARKTLHKTKQKLVDRIQKYVIFVVLTEELKYAKLVQ